MSSIDVLTYGLLGVVIALFVYRIAYVRQRNRPSWRIGATQNGTAAAMTIDHGKHGRLELQAYGTGETPTELDLHIWHREDGKKDVWRGTSIALDTADVARIRRWLDLWAGDAA